MELAASMWRTRDAPVATTPGDVRTLLRAHRLHAGLTQEALAERAGLSVRAIQNLERGERRPYPDTTARLVAALDLHDAERAAFELAARPQPRTRPDAPRTPPTNLPGQLTACIGRQAELDALAASLRQQRLVTLTGPGGAGKTRLALHLGTTLAAAAPSGGLQVPDGVWLVELDAIADPGLVVQSVASTLGVREERERALAATLVDALHGRRLLLLLDNCEHVLPSCARLIDLLLGRCPHLRVLATSRQPLGLPGEVVHVVQPLELPPSEPDPASLLACASAHLFVERARAAAPGFAVDPHNTRQIAAVCRRLDGIPLALELAAARLRGLSVADLAARLGDPFRLLTTSTARRPRQQSLRAAIGWSYQLLDERLRWLLRAVAVFSGGWTIADAESVCGPLATEGLAELVDHSLVQVDWRDPLGPRYRLLETVRQYAVERLEAAGEAGSARDVHLHYFLTLAESAAAGLDGPDQLTWARRLDAEQGNLRVALQRAAQHSDPELGLRLAAALGGYWDLRGERTEGLGWLERALARAPAAAPVARAIALRAAGRLALAMRNRDAAAWLDESLALSRALDDQLGVVRSLVQLGRLSVERADLARATAVLHAAQALAEQIGDSPGLAAALVTFGQAELDACHHQASLPVLERSLDLFRQVGDRAGQANALRCLAMACLEVGQPQAAAAPLGEAQSLLRDLGDAVGVAWTEHDFGRLALDSGQLAEAAAQFEHSLHSFRALGHGSGAAWSLHNLGRARLAQGEPAAAAELFEAGLALFRQLGHPRGIGWALDNLAWAAAERGRRGAAWAWLVEGFSLFRAHGYLPGLVSGLVVAARLVLDDDAAQATRWLAAAERLLERTDYGPGLSNGRRGDLVRRWARDRLGPAAFATAWAAGYRVSAAELDEQLDQVPAQSTRLLWAASGAG